MSFVISASVFLAIWHVSPRTRFFVTIQWITFVALETPYRFYRRKRPGPLSDKQILGIAAYYFLVLAGSLSTMFLFPKLRDVMAGWPG